ncbi:hypothetical protein [Burkholderia sp. KBS0801]|uniref:hypothetical protein n=1 Tax=Burkholderia sp. KBS0801 TaxID=1179675 RepID=UPI00110EC063|nr:hypothetical protein [Burkholderia sp. KBS0801]QDW54817.1 hypothetical protein FFI87_031705 [Burkholderia sp. KBS0801]
MQKFDFTAPASGAPQQVNAPGRYLKYVTGNAGGNDTGLIVTPGGKPGSKILLYPGQAITLPPDGTAGPNAWTIANAVGQGQIAGSVVIGNGRIDDNTLQGTVAVVDGSKARTMANNAYVGFTSIAAVSGQFSRVQLWNPANNPNRIVLRALLQMGSGNVADSLLLYGQTAALATLGQQGQPKLLGGTASLASIRSDSTVTGPTVAAADLLFGLSTTVTIAGWTPTEPMVIPPGFGLTVWSSITNLGIGAAFEWYEEPNV